MQEGVSYSLCMWVQCVKTATRCTALSSFLPRISALLQKTPHAAAWSCIHRGGHSPERSKVRQSHPNGAQRAAKAWETNTEGQFRLEGGMHSPPRRWCVQDPGEMAPRTCREGLQEPPSSIPLWILLPFPVTPTLQGFPKLQRKSVMSSGRFSRLPAPP